MATSNRTPKIHRIADDVSGGLLLLLLVWAPWAFGCTTPWAINTLVTGSYILGLLWAVKLVARWRTGYEPERWAGQEGAGRWIIRSMAVLMVVFLAWVLIGAANGRAEVVAEIRQLGPQLRYFDREPVSWLPASYDVPYSWRALWRWTGLALAFWAARDWLLGKNRRERHSEKPADFPPARLRWLLWTLSLSGALLAVICILQRLDGTRKLLWLLEPVDRARGADFSFGPYTYRTNAAQYFNLLWPVVLGFWWSLRQATKAREGLSARAGTQPHVVLLPCALLMAAAPIVSTSRGGALIMLAQTVGALVLMGTSRAARNLGTRIALGATFLGMLGLGWFLGGEQLKGRFANAFIDRLNGREDIYVTASRMAKDFGWKGSGADTFAGLNYLYRSSPDEKWQGYVHNDWLELQITLGIVGLILVVLLLSGAAVSWWTARGLRAPREFSALLSLALAGLLIHARVDFPFQIISLSFTFLILVAAGMASAHRTAG